MKDTPSRRALQFTRETLRRLDEKDLAAVDGALSKTQDTGNYACSSIQINLRTMTYADEDYVRNKCLAQGQC